MVFVVVFPKYPDIIDHEFSRPQAVKVVRNDCGMTIFLLEKSKITQEKEGVGFVILFNRCCGSTK